VYRTDIRTLILEGALVFVMFIVFDIIYELVQPVISGQLKGPEQNMKKLLDIKIVEMQAMAELYGTYLDSRSMLADQFRITEQIMEDLKLKIGSTAEGKHNVREKFQMDISISQLAASGLINGDCCGWSDIGRGRTAMVVSDGMGKGKKAAAESLMVTRTIISLLKSGVTAELTLKMINTIMLMKDDEDSYATVDLVIVDRKSGRCRFFKYIQVNVE
jgi:serine phosphatase RsbU (regulator of sigma subunit)